MVQTVKNILEKCDEKGGDPYLGLLSYRATPLNHHLRSPAELLTRRKFRTLLPMSHCANLTDDSAQVKEQLQRQQEQHGHYYNLKAKILDHQTKTWEPGTVVRTAKAPRSYLVRNSKTTGVYRRTRSHLRPTMQHPMRNIHP